MELPVPAPASLLALKSLSVSSLVDSFGSGVQIQAANEMGFQVSLSARSNSGAAGTIGFDIIQYRNFKKAQREYEEYIVKKENFPEKFEKLQVQR